MITQIENNVSTLAADVARMLLERQLSPVPIIPPTFKDATPVVEKPQVIEELVIEEVSIDGMCGVY